jgi:hydrogenase-4 component F
MGIVACGIAFGARFAVTGALLHAVNHSATKSLAFLSAGRLANRYDTREMSGIRGAITALPVSGTLFALAGLALAGMPPFGTFRSELMILAGGFAGRTWYLAIILLALLVIAFAGIVRWSTGVCAGEKPPEMRRGEGDVFALVAVLAGFAVVIGLGLFVPAPLTSLLERAFRIVEGA